MKKEILLLAALFLLFLISCAPVNQDELKAQAAAQLQNVSDEELQQLAEQSEEGSALAGQGYRLNPTANAVLRRLSISDRNTIVTAEQA